MQDLLDQCVDNIPHLRMQVASVQASNPSQTVRARLTKCWIFVHNSRQQRLEELLEQRNNRAATMLDQIINDPDRKLSVWHQALRRGHHHTLLVECPHLYRDKFLAVRSEERR